jgi:two-component system LytT family response regulator
VALTALVFAVGLALFLVSRGVPLREVFSAHLTRLFAWYALAVVGIAAAVLALTLRDGLTAAAWRARRQSIQIDRLAESNAGLAAELEQLRRAAQAGPNWIAVKSIGKVEFIDPARVIWMAAARNYVELHLSGRTVLHRAALKELLRDLDGEGFVQVHRSAAVNVAHIERLTREDGDKVTLALRDGAVVTVGPNFRSDLIARLEAARAAG